MFLFVSLFLTKMSLKDMLSYGRAEKLFSYNNGPYFCNASDQGIKLDPQSGLYVKDMLLVFLEEAMNGALLGYTNPKLSTALHPFQRNDPLQTIQGSDFVRKLQILYDAVKKGDRTPFHFRLGENWVNHEEKNSAGTTLTTTYDTLVMIGGPEDISITQRTKTEHLEPFIDGRVEDGMIVLAKDGEDFLREGIRPPTHRRC
jgi:hypothetical protein